jgi:hypothetical protein
MKELGFGLARQGMDFVRLEACNWAQGRERATNCNLVVFSIVHVTKECCR